MKPSLYIDPSGVIRYIAECPEEPNFEELKENKLYGDYKFFSGCSDKDVYEQYQQQLHAAKDSAVEFADQEQAKRIIWQDRTGLPVPNNEIYYKRDTIHPLPDNYSVEVGCNVDCQFPYACRHPASCSAFKKLAYLIPVPQIEKFTLMQEEPRSVASDKTELSTPSTKQEFELLHDKEQNDMWWEVLKLISLRLPYRAVLPDLMKQFTITRRKP